VSIQGWLVQLPVPRYSTPSICASCCAPRETEVSIQTSEKRGNIRTTLTLTFPYCAVCAKRLTMNRTRSMLVFLGGMGIGVVFALAFAFANVFFDLTTRTIIAAVFAMPAALGVALLLRLPPPPEPATARGDAVFLRGVGGLVLCTNERFAYALSQANGTISKPGSKLMTTESWAPFAAILGGGLAIAGFAYWAPGSMHNPPREYTSPAYTSPAYTTPARSPAPVRPRR